MKRWIIYLLVIIFIGTGYAVLFREEKIKNVDFMIFGEYRGEIKKLVEEFEKKERGIKVNIVEVDYFDFVSNLEERYKKGEKIADCFIVINDHIAPLIEKGIIEEADRTMLTDTIEKSKEGFLYKGKYYGYPYKGETLYLFYNPELARDIPDDIEGVLALGKKIKSEKGIKGIDFPTNEYYYHFPWYTYCGGKNENLIEMRRYTASLAKELNFTRDYFEFSNYTTAVGDFIDGKSAMMINGSWAFEHLEKAMSGKYKYKMIRDPRFRPFLGIKGLVISKNSKVKREAKLLVKYLTGEEGQERMALQKGFIPLNEKVFDKSDAVYIKEVRENIGNLEIMPNDKKVKEFWEKSYTILGKVFQDKKGVEESINEVYKER